MRRTCGFGGVSDQSISLSPPRRVLEPPTTGRVSKVRQPAKRNTGNNCSIRSERVMVHEPFSTPVRIPDANLRAAVETALGKDSGAPITQAEMATLDSLVSTAYWLPEGGRVYGLCPG